MEKKMEMLAREIYEWCMENELWGDNIIYFNGKAWSSFATWSMDNGKQIGERLYEYEDKNPLDYFEYANPKTLSMSFEGDLYSVLNAYVRGWTRLDAQFLAIFEKYGYYYEMGNSWNLAAYKI